MDYRWTWKNDWQTEFTSFELSADPLNNSDINILSRPFLTALFDVKVELGRNEGFADEAY